MAEQPWMMAEDEVRALLGRVRAGRSLAPSHWPGGARAAVALSFDCDHETFELGGGGRAIGRLAWGEYGRRVGVPRILDVLGRHDVPASFFMKWASTAGCTRTTACLMKRRSAIWCSDPSIR
jgi:peptidoglycan/xylan/chitin deacetylase (PgdA/CDA1 family)